MKKTLYVVLSAMTLLTCGVVSAKTAAPFVAPETSGHIQLA